MRFFSLFPLAITVLLLSSGISQAERLAVTATVGNIRSGPGSTYDVIWQVETNYPLNVVKKSGKWCLFKDFEGDEGWIHQSLLGKIQTVVTKRDNCNIRSGPGTRFDVLFTVEKGVPFKVLKKQGVWLYLEHDDGDQGWIHSALVW
jgi:SH3-like domain-containing protein